MRSLVICGEGAYVQSVSLFFNRRGPNRERAPPPRPDRAETDRAEGGRTGAALAAIERANPRLGAVIEVYAGAAKAGHLHSGPLHGVPFLTKNIGPRFAGLRVE